MSSVVKLKVWSKNLRKRNKIVSQPHELFWSPPRNKVKRGRATTVQLQFYNLLNNDFISLITKLLTIKWARPSRLSVFRRGSLRRFVLTCFLGYLLKKRFHWGTVCWLVVTMVTAFLQLENHIQASGWGGQDISNHKGTNNTSLELADLNTTILNKNEVITKCNEDNNLDLSATLNSSVGSKTHQAAHCNHKSRIVSGSTNVPYVISRHLLWHRSKDCTGFFLNPSLYQYL